MTTETEQLTAPYALTAAADLIEQRGLCKNYYTLTIDGNPTSLGNDDAYIPCAVAALAMACGYTKRLDYIIGRGMDIQCSAPEHLRRNKNIFLKSLMLLHERIELDKKIRPMDIKYSLAEDDIRFWSGRNDADTVVSAMREVAQILIDLEGKQCMDE